jgi:hypothetical protein
MADNIKRLAASLAQVTGKSDKTDQVFAVWAEEVTTAEGPLRFRATTTSDVARGEWHIEGDAEAIVNALGGWLSEFGLAYTENKRFTETTAKFLPKRIGGVVFHDHGLDAGWFLPLDDAIYSDVFEFERYVTEGVYELTNWCIQTRVRHCSRLVRFVGTAHSEIWMTVPGAGEKAVDVALTAFDVFLKSSPPAEARAALIAAAGGGVDIVFGHRAAGTKCVGVNVRRPSKEHVLALARTVTASDEARLAAFEKGLGVDGPAGAEYRIHDNRTELLLHYDVGERP